MQGLESVEFLQLLSREIGANLGVELLDDWLRRRSRLLMDRFKLRFDRVDERLHLGLLRIGQVEDVRQHRGHVRAAVMEAGASVRRSFRARDGGKREDGRTAKS